MNDATATARPDLMPGLAKTTIATKLLMAITGAIWVGYLVVHMSANLLVFVGRDALNAYAHALKSTPAFLWPARILLALAFIGHVWAGIRLATLNRAARQSRYRNRRDLRTNVAARLMLLSGLIVLAFFIYHLLHFTLGVTNPDHFALRDARGRADVYGMVVNGFQTPAIAAVYLVSMGLLAMHLSHAVTSMLNTAGLTTAEGGAWRRFVGPTIAAIIVLGNILIVVGVWLGLAPDPKVI